MPSQTNQQSPAVVAAAAATTTTTRPREHCRMLSKVKRTIMANPVRQLLCTFQNKKKQQQPLSSTQSNSLPSILSRNLKRQQQHSRLGRHGGHVVIPMVDDGTTTTRSATTTPNRLETLPSHLTLQIYGYCDKVTLQSLRMVDQRTDHILSSDEAMTDIWKPLVYRLFFGGRDGDSAINGQEPNNTRDRIKGSMIDPSILLRYDPPPTMLPSTIHLADDDDPSPQRNDIDDIDDDDDDLRNSSNSTSSRSQSLLSNSSTPTFTRHDRCTIQFRGTTGQDDRSVRADAAFPTRKIPVERLTMRAVLRRKRKTSDVVRPFLMPVTDPTTGCLQIVATKRAYYEVTILPSTQEAMNNNDTTNDGGSAAADPTFSIRSYTDDCVSVGLSMVEFSLIDGQPGWDEYSFGLHGDDGALFHGNGGRKIRQYYPQSLQRGDTIGCGIDYEQRSIFYTVNGIFTGHAFHLSYQQLGQCAWYPTVGIDTNHIVRFNLDKTSFYIEIFIIKSFNEKRIELYFF